MFLSILGVEDYGIYNVVGGMVAMFGLVSGGLSNASSRFMTFELGANNLKKLRQTFSTSVIVQALLGVIIFALIEIIGMWYLNHKMVLPPDRLYAAKWVLHCTSITFVFNMMSIPYNALIIAHEHMKTFACVSIFESVLKLFIILGLVKISGDKLILYAIFWMLSSILIRIINRIYCRKHFSESRFEMKFNKAIFKEMFAYAGWATIGTTSGLFKNQGVNMVLNLFYGTTVNAARGLAMQVNNSITAFINSFTTAVNPQITKSYAAKDYDYMLRLIFGSAKFSFFLMMFLSMPVLIETQFLLTLWLKTVPEFTVIFVKLIIINTLSDILSQQLITAQSATGKIRNYQLVVGGLQILNLPLSYLALKLGFTPPITIVISIILSQFSLLARLVMLKKNIKISIRQFFYKVYLRVGTTFLISLILPIFVYLQMSPSWERFLAVGFSCVISCALMIIVIGCDKKERGMIIEKATQIKNRIFKR